MKILFVWPNKDSFGFKPIGLSILAAIAGESGWTVGLFDTTGIDFGYTDNTESGQRAKIFKPVDLSKYGLEKRDKDLKSSFLKILKDFSPDCLAFTVLSDEFLIAKKIAALAKEASPKIKIIWGGKYPTLNPQETLEYHNVDFVCIGEGLLAFADFLGALKNDKNPYNIPNIWAKNANKIIKNDIRPLKENLDDLPFVNWDIFDKRQFVKPFDGEVYIGGDHMLNWGCPYHCTYCINSFYQQLYKGKYFMRRYGVERIINELKYLKHKYNIQLFKFHDEDFLMRPIENLRELSTEYKKEINIPFVIETNSKSVVAEKVRLLKDMNCVSASVAIESGDSDLRSNLLKRVDSETDILRAFSLFKEYDIRTSSFNLLGIPFESRKTYNKTINLNRRANVQYPSIGFFYPFEGTELRRVSTESGFFDPVKKESIVYNRNKPPLVFKNLSAKALVQMREVFVLYVKLPKSFWPFIRRSEKLDGLGLKIRNKLLDIYNKLVWGNDGWYTNDGREKKYLRGLRTLFKRRKVCA